MDYIAYNLRSYFARQPGQPTRCPNCGHALSMESIEPSAAVADDLNYPALIPAHDFSLLFVCAHCGWWCIRESWDWYEVPSGEWDFIVVGDGNGALAAEEKPWLKALADVKLYQQAEELPNDLARMFPKRGK